MAVTSSVLSFAALAGLLTVLPGLDTALVLRTAISEGRRHAFATALGINAGALLWGVGAALGVSALLTASTVAYAVLRIAGAAYLLWLGARLVRRAVQGQVSADPSLPFGPVGAWRCWRRGLLTNLLNPKIGAFYVAVLPQFIPPHTPHLAMGLLLALVHDLEGLLWFSVLILGAHAVRAWLGRRTTRRSLDGLTGVALIGFGLRLGLAR